MSAIPVNLPPPSSSAPDFARSRKLHNATARLVNRLAIAFCYASALLAIFALLLIFGYVSYKGLASINTDFFTKSTPYGMKNAIAGTLTLIAMASCIGIPLGMLCGIYLAEYARDNWFSHGIRLVVDVLAGIPSILMGVLGYQLAVMAYKPAALTGNSFVDFFVGIFNSFVHWRNATFPTHPSAWAGALALGVMMCPIIARTTEEMLRLVPKAQREASVGLGASKFQTLFRVVIPGGAVGIITGIMLAVARVAGETAPLLFTCRSSDFPVFTFNSHFPFVHAALNDPFPSLTVRIYQCYNDGNDQMWAGLFVLIVIVLILNIAVRVVSNRKKALR
jgi:phosphate transport system permease protein